jgi:hypothetical protein
MSLMYLARFTRADILMPVSYLATRSSNPTVEDFSKVMRILRYLSGTANFGITFKSTDDLRLRIYADASHALHLDGHGHAGFVFTLGSAPIYCRSVKIHSITRSSSESELVSLEESTTFVIWLRALLVELRGNISAVTDPTEVFQDNKSTIIMAVQGGSFQRSKHLVCKESFVRERILNQEVKLSYLPTGSMPADMLTKPLAKVALQRFMRFLNIK